MERFPIVVPYLHQGDIAMERPIYGLFTYEKC